MPYRSHVIITGKPKLVLATLLKGLKAETSVQWMDGDKQREQQLEESYEEAKKQHWKWHHALEKGFYMDRGRVVLCDTATVSLAEEEKKLEEMHQKRADEHREKEAAEREKCMRRDMRKLAAVKAKSFILEEANEKNDVSEEEDEEETDDSFVVSDSEVQ